MEEKLRAEHEALIKENQKKEKDRRSDSDSDSDKESPPPPPPKEVNQDIMGRENTLVKLLLTLLQLLLKQQRKT